MLSVLAAVLAAASAALSLSSVSGPRAGPGADPLVGDPRWWGGEDGASREPGGPARGRSARPWLLRAVAAVGVGSAVLLLVPGWAGLLLAPVATGLAWWRSRVWEPAAVRARRARVEAELPHLVDLLVACLAAGSDPAEALARVVAVVPEDVADELRPWVVRLRMGSDPVTVWAAMARHPQLGRLGVTLRRSAESGAPVGPALGRLADDLLARTRGEVETRVRQVEVKAAVPLGVCLLPAFVLLGVVPLVAGSALGFLAVR